MLDESFVRHVKMSAKPEDFLAALDDELGLVCLRAAAEPDAAGSVTRRARARVSDGDKLVPALRARPMIGARGGLLAAGRYRRVIGPTTTATALGSFKAL